MCPNVTPARYLIPGRAFTAANKMFIKCIPRWRDIYQHVDASPASKLPMQSGAEISQGSFGDEDEVMLSYPSPDRHRRPRWINSLGLDFFSPFGKALLPANDPDPVCAALYLCPHSRSDRSHSVGHFSAVPVAVFVCRAPPRVPWCILMTYKRSALSPVLGWLRCKCNGLPLQVTSTSYPLNVKVVTISMTLSKSFIARVERITLQR